MRRFYQDQGIQKDEKINQAGIRLKRCLLKLLLMTSSATQTSLLAHFLLDAFPESLFSNCFSLPLCFEAQYNSSALRADVPVSSLTFRASEV